MKTKKKISENSFEAGLSGTGGTSNYSTGYGTPSGGNVTQSPDKFSSSDKTTTHFAANTVSGSALPKLPDSPNRVPTNRAMADPSNKNKENMGKSGITAAGDFSNAQLDKPLDPDKQFDPEVDKLFHDKKNTPSPDDIMSALQYELGRMVKKDKTIAKQVVLKNLQRDPQFYSRLHMLNIDDKTMQVDECSTFSKTKSLLDAMVAERQKNRPVAESKEISDIFRDLSNKRKSYRNFNSKEESNH